MATDYDAPRKNDDDVAEDSIEELKSRRNDSGSANEELTVHVVPKQDDEFTCSMCFLVHHASQLAYVDDNGQPVCTECAG